MKYGNKFKEGDILIIIHGKEDSSSNNYYLKHIKKLEFKRYIKSRSHKIKCRLKIILGSSSGRDYEKPMDNGWGIPQNGLIDLFEDVLMLESEKEFEYSTW